MPAACLPVFPCNGKLPRTEHGFHDASTDTDTVISWWQRWPDANIGIATGARSGLVVLDVDVQHGGQGTLNERGKLPEAPEVLTGGGGKHIYFVHPGGEVRYSAGKLGPGLDVRGDGGYMVAPPSVHENGRAYKWLRELGSPPPLPAWLLEEAEQRPNGPAPPVESVIPQGKRRGELLSLAGTLRRRGLGGDEILAALTAVNEPRCRPPLERQELEELAQDVGRRYRPDTTLGRPAYDGPPSALEETVAVFTRWLHLPDVEPVYATLGAAAANYLPGTPVWLVLVGPPANGKTELLGSLSRLPDVYHAATLTEASLLSGAPRREHASGAKGGLLSEVGDFGLIVLKDMGSILSMRPDAKAEILAALREVYDGAWTRYVGTDGGKTLAWNGKVGLIAGATPVLDRRHGVLSVMGERFTLCRLGEATDEQAVRALEHTGGQETAMRDELATAVAALFAGRHEDPQPLSDEERQELVRLAGLIARARSAVERDRATREIEQVPGAEGPARLALTFERLLAGLDTLNADRELAWRIVRRVALDCIPALRRQLLEHLNEHAPPQATKAIAETLDLPTNTVRRALEDLAAYGVVKRYGQGQGKSDVWAASDWLRERLA